MILKSKIFNSADYARKNEELEFNKFLLDLQSDKEFVSFEQIFPRRYDILVMYWVKKLDTCDITSNINTSRNEFSNLVDKVEKERCINAQFCDALNEKNVNFESNFSNFEYNR